MKREAWPSSGNYLRRLTHSVEPDTSMLLEKPSLREGREALVIFQGAEAYITPSWYVSKAEHGKVVPTWNYVVVQAWGTSRVIDDPAWLRIQIDELTRKQERDRSEPWNVTDAPESFVQSQIKGITGLEIEVSRIEGKWKVSQNRPEEDRDSVMQGLRTERRDDVMASIVAERGLRNSD